MSNAKSTQMNPVTGDAFEARIEVVYAVESVDQPLPVTVDVRPGQRVNLHWRLASRALLCRLECVGPADVLIERFSVSNQDLLICPVAASDFAPPGPRYASRQWVVPGDLIELVILRP